MKIIDLETHYAVDEAYALKGETIKGYSDTSENIGGKMVDPLQRVLSLDNIEERLKLMEEAGIDACVMSHQAGIEAADPAIAVKLAQTVNNKLYEVTQKYKGRVYGWAALPMRAPEEAAKELERCIKELGFFGWNVYSNFNIKQRLDDPMFRPVLEKANELGCLTYIHPTAPNIDEYQGFGPSVWGGIGYAADTCLTLIRMMQVGVFDEFPNIKFILGHLGEGLPFVMKRMSNGRLDGNRKFDFDHYMTNNIWVTFSGNYDPASFRCTCDVIGADRIMFGSDYPMEPFARAADFFAAQPLSVAGRELISMGTALKLQGDRKELFI